MRQRKTPVPTRERLRELFDYDPLSGLFTRKLSVGRKKFKPGTIAGCVEARGYINIGVDGVIYRAHQLAYLYMTGEWPDDTIDHWNRVKSDNRWENLRPATMQEQAWNMDARGASGLRGVRQAAPGRWYAGITVDRQFFYLGSFDTPEAAHEAYLAAKAVHHPGAPLH